MFKRGQPLGSYARHYYDLFQLAAQPAVPETLRSPEYHLIKQDYDLLSRMHFDRGYFYPDGMSFANSEALFPPAELAATLGAEYAAQCRLLCYGSFPDWDDVQRVFATLRDLL